MGDPWRGSRTCQCQPPSDPCLTKILVSRTQGSGRGIFWCWRASTEHNQKITSVELNEDHSYQDRNYLLIARGGSMPRPTTCIWQRFKPKAAAGLGELYGGQWGRPIQVSGGRHGPGKLEAGGLTPKGATYLFKYLNYTHFFHANEKCVSHHFYNIDAYIVLQKNKCVITHSYFCHCHLSFLWLLLLPFPSYGTYLVN